MLLTIVKEKCRFPQDVSWGMYHIIDTSSSSLITTVQCIYRLYFYCTNAMVGYFHTELKD